MVGNNKSSLGTVLVIVGVQLRPLCGTVMATAIFGGKAAEYRSSLHCWEVRRREQNCWECVIGCRDVIVSEHVSEQESALLGRNSALLGCGSVHCTYRRL
jgi:hypothetical protein